MVGSLNTFVDLSIYALLTGAHLSIFVANIFSTSCGLVVSYLLNRSFTFKSNGENRKKEIVLFLGVTLFGLWVIQPLVIFLVIHLFGSWFTFLPDTIERLVPKCLAIGVALVWNYILYNKVVFKYTSNNK